MVRFTLDGRAVTATSGETVLAVARREGVPIPTLCNVAGLEPLESCFVCVVAVEGHRTHLPSCALRAQEGMVVTTDSPALRAARQMALELLLSEHHGECEAPCELGCPARWDIAGFMLAAADDLAAAEAIARDGLAIPATLGYVCPAPCENACRRAVVDETVAIRELHRFTAIDPRPRPETPPETGKRVAIVGAGPAGLGAAYALRKGGHACEVIFEGDGPGGTLRALPAAELPPEVLDAEVAVLGGMGVIFTGGVRLGRDVTLDALRERFDAVLLALGEDGLARSGLLGTLGRSVAHPRTRATVLEGVYAAGAFGKRGRLAVRAVADGFAAAASVDRWLAGAAGDGVARPILVRYGELDDAETALLLSAAVNGGVSAREVRDAATARGEAERCLICGCRNNDACDLRQVSTALGATPACFPGQRRALIRDDSHPDVIHEAHKCIVCGACVRVSEAAGADPGIAIIGRGYETRVAAAWDGPLAEAFDRETALRCAAVCPTNALRPKSKFEREE